MGIISLLRRYPRISALFTGLALLYLGFTLLPSPNKQSLKTYHLTATQLRLLLLTIVLPYLVIWSLTLTGYLRLRYYSDLISRSKDGRAFVRVSWGVLVLALWLPATAVIGAVSSYVYLRHPGTSATLVIIDNYVNMFILIASFVLLDRGAKMFAGVTRSIKNAPNQLLIMGFLAFATFYTWLALNDPIRRHPGHNVLRATYYEPDWLIVLTLIIPRLIMWFLGMQAAQNLYYYRQKVKGKIYKSSLFRVSFGIAFVITSTIVLQSIQSLDSQIQRLSLGVLLLIIYALLIMIGAGYYLIAKGSKNLLQIETS